MNAMTYRAWQSIRGRYFLRRNKMATKFELKNCFRPTLSKSSRLLLLRTIWQVKINLSYSRSIPSIIKQLSMPLSCLRFRLFGAGDFAMIFNSPDDTKLNYINNLSSHRFTGARLIILFMASEVIKERAAQSCHRRGWMWVTFVHTQSFQLFPSDEIILRFTSECRILRKLIFLVQDLRLMRRPPFPCRLLCATFDLITEITDASLPITIMRALGANKARPANGSRLFSSHIWRGYESSLEGIYPHNVLFLRDLVSSCVKNVKH